MTSPRLSGTAPQTEADWQRVVTDLAQLLGWRWIHHRPARTSKGHRTAVSGSHAAGEPDLLLVRERVLCSPSSSHRPAASPQRRLTGSRRYVLPALKAHRWLLTVRDMTGFEGVGGV